MTTDKLHELTADLPEAERDAVRERAAIMAEANHWDDETANRRAWTEYLERKSKAQRTML